MILCQKKHDEHSAEELSACEMNSRLRDSLDMNERFGIF